MKKSSIVIIVLTLLLVLSLAFSAFLALSLKQHRDEIAEHDTVDTQSAKIFKFDVDEIDSIILNSMDVSNPGKGVKITDREEIEYIAAKIKDFACTGVEYIGPTDGSNFVIRFNFGDYGGEQAVIDISQNTIKYDLIAFKTWDADYFDEFIEELKLQYFEGRILK